MSAGQTDYRVEARRGEAAAREAVARALATAEPGHIVVATLAAVEAGGPYEDGLFHVLGTAALAGAQHAQNAAG
jgi:hypothetical protein